MKFRIVLVLLAITLAASSSVTARAGTCSNSTIRGNYAFTVHGQIFTPNGPVLIDGIAKTTFDGNGNFTQVDAVADNGNIAQVWRPGVGTYTLDSDCKGTMILVTQGQAFPLHLAILVSRSGELIHTVVTNPGVAVTSDAERMLTPGD